MRKTFMQPKSGLDPGSDTIKCAPWKLAHISEPHFPTLQNEGDNTYSMYNNTKKPGFAAYSYSLK